jgi:tetratricopeptide (TPR) repeat protein
MLASVVLLATFALAQDVPPAAPPAIEPVRPAAPAISSAVDSTAAPGALEAGLKAYKHRQFAQAEAQFQRAVAADPTSAAAAYYLGYAIYKRVEKHPFHADKARAAKYFDQAFTLDPSFRPDWGKPKR